MIQQLHFFLAFMLLCIFGINPGFAYTYSPGGSSCENPTGLNTSGVIIEGEIRTPGEIDYFSMDAWGPGQVFTCYTIGDLDTEGLVYNQYCDNLIITDDDSGSGLNFHISFDSRTVNTFIDEFVIAVKAHNNRDTGGYILYVNRDTSSGAEPLIPFGDVHGDACSTATDIEIGSATDGALYPITDKDFFKISVPSSGELIVSIEGLLTGYGTVRPDIYDSNCNELSSRTLERGGTYYLCVSGLGHGSYTLYADFEEDDSGGDTNNDTDVSDDLLIPIKSSGGGGGGCFINSILSR